jgi:hemin uptake protein HemP
MANDNEKMQKSSPSEDPTEKGSHVIKVEELFAGAREITLLHQGEHYRLRLTASNKLILTK